MCVLFYLTFDSFSKMIFNVTIHLYLPVYGMIDLLKDNCIKYSSLLSILQLKLLPDLKVYCHTFLQSQGIYKYASWQKGFSITIIQGIVGYTLYVHVSSLIDKWDLDRIHAQGGMIWTTSSDCSFAFGVF